MTASVLHLANHCERGGNVHLAVDLACEQAARGQRVTFASAGGRYTALLERCGVRHVLLEQNLRRRWGAARAAGRTIALCRDCRPDVIHAHMMSGAVLGAVAGRLLGVPLVTTVHNSFDRHAWLMRLGDAIVAVSRSDRELLLARGFPARRLVVVVNGTLASYSEPFGLGILEAREAGCAVLGSRVGGIAEQLGPDRFGLTFPPGRPDLIAVELRRLMTDAPALEAAKSVAREGLAEYHVGRMADDYAAVYAGVTGGARVAAPAVPADLPQSLRL